jgi:hypothetical protein
MAGGIRVHVAVITVGLEVDFLRPCREHLLLGGLSVGDIEVPGASASVPSGDVGAT